jgi:hypothetical protein
VSIATKTMSCVIAFGDVDIAIRKRAMIVAMFMFRTLVFMSALYVCVMRDLA